MTTDDRGLRPGEIVAVPSELPDPENWEVYDPDLNVWREWDISTGDFPGNSRLICRPINQEEDA